MFIGIHNTLVTIHVSHVHISHRRALDFELAASIALTKFSAATNTVTAAYMHIDKVQITSV